MRENVNNESPPEPVRDERFYRSSEWQFYMLWLRGQGRDEEARQVCEEAIRFNPTPQARFALGVSLQRGGLLEEAITCYREATEQKPDFAAAHGNLGRALIAAGRYDEALASLERAQNISPNSSATILGIGRAYRAKNDLQRAIGVCRDAIAIRGNSDEDLRVALGDALREAGEITESLETLKSVVAEYPLYHEAHFALAQTLSAAGRNEEARQAADTVLVLLEEQRRESAFMTEEDEALEAKAKHFLEL